MPRLDFVDTEILDKNNDNIPVIMRRYRNIPEVEKTHVKMSHNPDNDVVYLSDFIDYLRELLEKYGDGHIKNHYDLDSGNTVSSMDVREFLSPVDHEVLYRLYQIM